jgi:hypothetical protein
VQPRLLAGTSASGADGLRLVQGRNAKNLPAQPGGKRDDVPVEKAHEEILLQRQAALGAVIEASASMEWALREAFCALVGSRFAKVIAAGQSVAWLVDSCGALIDAHEEVPAPARQAIRKALADCRAANESRNHLVHGIKSAILNADGSLHTIKSRRRTDIPIRRDWTVSSIHGVTGEISLASGLLHAAMENALPRESLVVDGGFTWPADSSEVVAE